MLDWKWIKENKESVEEALQKGEWIPVSGGAFLLG